MYISTRGGTPPVTASKAICKGIAADGGLYVPEKIVPFPSSLWDQLPQMSYQELAKVIFGLYLDDFTADDIDYVVAHAYADNFDDADIAPLHAISGHRYIMELWHGPTAAFKDLALQALPHLLTVALEKQQDEKEIVILVATSGDTGKAALEGFADVPKTKIIVFYPDNGVSDVQRLQMVTQGGVNTYVAAVKGNFDDCQQGVKEIFADTEFNAELEAKGFRLSSANSINWGRLLPQIVYYFKAYGSLCRDKAIAPGETIDVVVPTGNFGNILAAYYAKRMGLPIQTLLCASNQNKVLTDVITDGHYDTRRQFYRTHSPSMDILVSSNFERFVYELCHRDAEVVKKLFSDLKGNHHYHLPKDAFNEMRATIAAGYATDAETKETIGRTWKNDGYVLDPHTAVAVKVLEKFDSINDRGDSVAVIDATANPFKFNLVVHDAIYGVDSRGKYDEFTISDRLAAKTGLTIHRGLADIEKKPILHHRLVNKEDMRATVASILENS